MSTNARRRQIADRVRERRQDEVELAIALRDIEAMIERLRVHSVAYKNEPREH